MYYEAIQIINNPTYPMGIFEIPGETVSCVQCSKEFKTTRYSDRIHEFVFCLLKDQDGSINKAFIPKDSRLVIASLEEHLLCRACFDTERLLPTCENIDEISE